MLRIVNIIGARPNFMKIAPLYWAYSRYPKKIAPTLIHTGQHYDPDLSDVFLKQLGLPKPDAHLGVGSGSQSQQVAKILLALEPHLTRIRPDLVLVVGDTNSTLGAALASSALQIPLAHVEAGLRAHDWTMPEERNRILTDRLSQWLFTHSRQADENLIREGLDKNRIHFVGNVMIDSLLRLLSKARQSKMPQPLNGLEGPYAYLTLHRPSNVDDPGQLLKILRALLQATEGIPLVWPVHPRAKKTLSYPPISNLLRRSVSLKMTPPLGYLEGLRAMSQAKLILTDSGGVQEESTVLGIRCLTLRENTERPVTVTHGTNRVIGTLPDRIHKEVQTALKKPPTSPHAPPLWDGRSSERIVKILLHG